MGINYKEIREYESKLNEKINEIKLENEKIRLNSHLEMKKECKDGMLASGASEHEIEEFMSELDDMYQNISTKNSKNSTVSMAGKEVDIDDLIKTSAMLRLKEEGIMPPNMIKGSKIPKPPLFSPTVEVIIYAVVMLFIIYILPKILPHIFEFFNL